jgi:hypothetical protein
MCLCLCCQVSVRVLFYLDCVTLFLCKGTTTNMCVHTGHLGRYPCLYVRGKKK